MSDRSGRTGSRASEQGDEKAHLGPKAAGELGRIPVAFRPTEKNFLGPEHSGPASGQQTGSVRWPDGPNNGAGVDRLRQQPPKGETAHRPRQLRLV